MYFILQNMNQFWLISHASTKKTSFFNLRKASVIRCVNTCAYFYQNILVLSVSRSRIHEHTVSLRFLGIILRVLRLEVSVNNVYTQSTYFPRDETGLVCLPTQLERTIHCNFTGEGKCNERGVGVHPPPTPARANFTLITECTPESSGCNSVYSVVYTTV
jgi:hypothetical protein